jgi:dihydrofolate reductase
MESEQFNDLLGWNLTLSRVAQIVDECPYAMANSHGMDSLLDRGTNAAWDIAWFLLERGRLYPAAADVMKQRLPNRATIVAAVGKNGQIGLDGKVPWRVPADLAHFRALTLGETVLVGRKTFESMGALKGRTVVVVSSGHVPGADRVTTDPLDPNLPERLFVCGGSSIYREYLVIADRMVLSRMEYDGPADAFFPSDGDIADTGWLQIGSLRRDAGFVVHEYVRRLKGPS